MTFGSVCSGIGAPETAWAPLGWRGVWCAEIEPFPCAVLAHHWPHVPNVGDMAALPAMIRAGEVEAPDALVGGTPCQSFSVAGRRLGLADPRGNLALIFLEIADAIDAVRRAAGKPPCWIVWENVPGVQSDNGNALGCFLAAMVGGDTALPPLRSGSWPNAGVVDGPDRCAAWRILDAQYFGVAQRRRRIFVLARGGAGDWDAPDALLPIVESLRWHPAPSREARPGATVGTLGGTSPGGGWRFGADEAAAGQLIPTLAHTLRGDGFDASEDGTGRGTPLVPYLSTTLRARDGSKGVDSDCTDTLVPVQVFGGNNTSGPIDVAPALNACSAAAGRQDFESEAFVVGSPCAFDARPAVATFVHCNKGRPNGRQSRHTEMVTAKPLVETLTTDGHAQSAVHVDSAVRRLTPREAERLQGFRDDHTLISYRGKLAADSPRYRALGNSMAVPVMAHIGRAIMDAAR